MYEYKLHYARPIPFTLETSPNTVDKIKIWFHAEGHGAVKGVEFEYLNDFNCILEIPGSHPRPRWDFLTKNPQVENLRATFYLSGLYRSLSPGVLACRGLTFFLPLPFQKTITFSKVIHKKQNYREIEPGLATTLLNSHEFNLRGAVNCRSVKHTHPHPPLPGREPLLCSTRSV